MLNAGPMTTSGRFGRIISFLFLWLLIGFSLGTLVLVAPVRWTVDAVQSAGGGAGAENAAVIALVVVYVLASAWLALRLNRYLFATQSRVIRFGVPAALLLIALAIALQWKDPSVMLSGLAGGGKFGDVRTASGAVFEFGSFPDEARMQQLKREGVTTIISLQHPAVPVERGNIGEEMLAAKKYGLKFISAPMLPWFSRNEEALDTLKALAKHGHGKYYVHCGLGRDRVNVARKLIEGLGVKSVRASDLGNELGFEHRTRTFMHGELYNLAPGVWLTPYPEHAEIYSCFLEGRPGHIVLILDPAEPVQKKEIDNVTGVFEAYAIPYIRLPVGAATGANALAAADSVHKIPPPVTIVGAETPWRKDEPREGAENALAFRAAYLAHSPPGAKNGKGSSSTYVPPKPAVSAQDVSRSC